MTAQKLSSMSSATDAYKTFKQTLQNKSNLEMPLREQETPVAIPRDKLQQQEQERHRGAMVVTDTDTEASMQAPGSVNSSGGGAAIPMSPPSSPTHVVVAPAQEQVPLATPTTASQTSIKRSGATAVASNSNGSGGGGGPSPPVVTPNSVPIRLGRGRKLCPNCKALTKSAVKQCRECKHVFSPASSRLRAQNREPKENQEDAPVLPRRRHRPSQRLLESLVVSEEPSTTSTAEVRRHPLAAASNSSAESNQNVNSSAGSTSRESHPAVPAGVTGVKVPLPGCGSGSGQKQPQKRSHKRKVPLLPGVAPPKRNKNALEHVRSATDSSIAATSGGKPVETTGADANAGATASSNPSGPLGIFPLLSLTERQRVAENLLASPTHCRHALVPDSPDIGPVATPAGPLLFMSSSTSSNVSSYCLDDDSAWLSRSGGGDEVGGSVGGSVNSAVPSQAAGCAFADHQHQPQHLLFPTGPSTGLVGLLLGDDEEDQQGLQQQQQQQLPAVRNHENADGIDLDLSAESQDKDPFADVEISWEIDGATAMNSCAGTTGGRDGTALEQRVVFPQDTELLGDTDDALTWTPLRVPSFGESSSGTSMTVGLTTATSAVAQRGRSLAPTGVLSNSPLQPMLSLSLSSSSSSLPLRGKLSSTPDGKVLPSFERGAALASAANVPTGGGITGSSTHPEYLLAEASCSSLPEPLVFATASGGRAVPAVSADSKDDVEAGGFWNPLQAEV